jgi:hypothetical protein
MAPGVNLPPGFLDGNKILWIIPECPECDPDNPHPGTRLSCLKKLDLSLRLLLENRGHSLKLRPTRITLVKTRRPAAVTPLAVAFDDQPQAKAQVFACGGSLGPAHRS